MGARGGQIRSDHPPSRVRDNPCCHRAEPLKAIRGLHCIMSSPSVESTSSRDRARADLRQPVPYTRTTRQSLPGRSGASSKLARMLRVPLVPLKCVQHMCTMCEMASHRQQECVAEIQQEVLGNVDPSTHGTEAHADTGFSKTPDHRRKVSEKDIAVVIVVVQNA